MRGVGLFAALLIAIVSGLIAGVVTRRRWSGLTYLLAGLAGSVLGGYLLDRLNLGVESGVLESFIASLLGALILLGLLGLVRRAR
jgi:uncharacterized membrane protein YeaQ/YmgE (transglycosylase-associated protein family)